MSGDSYKIRDQNGVHFVTFAIVGWLDIFVRMEYKNIVVDSLNHCIEYKGLNVHCWCLMTSHLHLIISAEDSFNLSDIIRDFKKHTAKTIIKEIKTIPESRREFLLWYFEREGKRDKRITQYKFWKEDNHAIYLHNTDVAMIEQKIEYIHDNPVKKGVVDKAEDYLFSSARDYIEIHGLIKVK